MNADLINNSSRGDLFEPLTKPFENIALSFSGGGFRAASFALGTLSYLDTVTFMETVVREKDGAVIKENEETSLLKKTKYLSSASGGTIATGLYALFSVQKGFLFKDYYAKLFKALDGDTLLGNALEILNSDKLWNSRRNKRRNFINAFALAYDQSLLFDGKTIKDLKVQDTPSHLEEVCFNATEFYRGLLFRQTVKLKKWDEKDKDFFFGNFVFHLDHEKAESLKLADVLAASSCFPAGFEPIAFPNDFLSGNETAESYIERLDFTLQTGGKDELKFLFGDLTDAQLQKNRDIIVNKLDRKGLVYKTLPTIGLMDGGITDNIGLDSLMKANERRIKKETSFEPFDFMMANDVASSYMDPFCVPEESHSIIGKLTLNYVIAIAAIISSLGVACLFTIVLHIPNYWKYIGVSVGTLLVLTGIIFFGTLLTISRFLGGTSKKGGLDLDRNFPPNVTNTLLSTFRNTQIRILVQMIKSRVASVLSLNTDVFLKRVRQLLYNGFFDSTKSSYRVKGNRIYDLSFSNAISRKESNLPHEPNDNIQKVAEKAVRMATTLWFDKESIDVHARACLIACGQFTTCYNLLLYVERLMGNPKIYACLDENYKKRINDIAEKLNKDYEHFNEDPFWLYNELGSDPNIETFIMTTVDTISLPEQFEGLSTQTRLP
jgi:hypothetical protein